MEGEASWQRLRAAFAAELFIGREEHSDGSQILRYQLIILNDEIDTTYVIPARSDFSKRNQITSSYSLYQ